MVIAPFPNRDREAHVVRHDHHRDHYHDHYCARHVSGDAGDHPQHPSVVDGQHSCWWASLAQGKYHPCKSKP
jgi:hypothetical protein